MTAIPIRPNSTVLVLNSTFEPIHIASGKRAIVLLLKNKAQILSQKVIRLLKYVRIPFSKIVSHKPSRSMIYKRDGNKCQYCGSTKHLTIDHIIPKSKGGGDNWSNLTIACSNCNTKKGDRLLEQTGMKLMKKPEAPKNPVELNILTSGNSEWQEYVFSGR